MFPVRKTLLAAGLAFGTTAALANDLTPQQLKSLCETAPANTITITGPVKVTNFATRVNVTSGCRIVMGPTAILEADSINMGFAGPLVFQGGLKSGVLLTKALLEAPSLTFDHAGGENLVSLGESTVRATTGNVVISMGQASQWTMASRFTGRAHAIIAAGSIQVTGSGKLDATLSDTSASGNTGISISGSGNEMTLNLGNASLVSTAGAINITSPGVQATMNHAVGQLRGATGVAVSFSGNEGQISIQQVTVNAGTGSASFVSALSGARPAKSIVTESNITAGGAVVVTAAVTGQSGEAAVETSRVTAGAAVEVRSGPLGTTNVKLNTLRSPSLVGAYTGPSGSCTAEGNSVVAPVRQLCLP